jgi:hypothetical protein
MVFAPVDPLIKEKVVAAYLAGKGRNQIERELHGQGIKVSHGSISNIINAYKCKHEQSSGADVNAVKTQEQTSATAGQNESGLHDKGPSQQHDGPLQPLPWQEAPSNNSKYTADDSVTCSPPFIGHKGYGQTVISSSVPSYLVVQADKTNGGPLSWLGIDKDAPIVTNEEPSTLIQGDPKSPEESVSKAIGSDINNDVDYLNNYVHSKNETTQTEEEFDDQPSFRSSAPEDQGPSVVIDRDPDEGYQRRLWRRILEEKEEKRRVIQLIEQRTVENLQIRQELNQAGNKSLKSDMSLRLGRTNSSKWRN